MSCFTFKSLKSLKAPGLDGFDTGLLNLHRERKQDWGRVGTGGRKKTGEGQRWELSLAYGLTPRWPQRKDCVCRLLFLGVRPDCSLAGAHLPFLQDRIVFFA